MTKILDIFAILTGLFGTFLNALLFWVIGRNRSIDKKCALLYKNLAAVDIINCFVIPICYFSISGHGYNSLDTYGNSVLYLIFGGIINIPYVMLILLSLVRVMIFKYKLFYERKVHLAYIRALCVGSWVLSFGAGVGVWICSCSIMVKKASRDVLIGLMKLQSVVCTGLIICSALLITTSLFLLQKLINKADRSEGSRTVSEGSITKPQNNVLVKELFSARRTFLYFLVSVVVWSSYPLAFSLSFTLCGPYYNSTSPQCQILQARGLADPKISYALGLLFLCGMSIANSIILLRQKSFKNVLLDLWVCILPNNSVVGTEQEPILQPRAPCVQRDPRALPGGLQIEVDPGNRVGELVRSPILSLTDEDESPETMQT